MPKQTKLEALYEVKDVDVYYSPCVEALAMNRAGVITSYTTAKTHRIKGRYCLVDNKIGDNGILPITANNTDDNNIAFGILDAITVGFDYVVENRGETIDRIRVYYPMTMTAFGVDDDVIGGDPQIRVRKSGIGWDTLLHEYGHYVAYRFEIDGFMLDSCFNTFHDVADNMSEPDKCDDKESGINFAWSEGWAAYFSLMSQQVMDVASFNVPDAGDEINTLPDGRNISLEQYHGHGEDNEFSVSTILWDLADSNSDEGDSIKYGHNRYDSYLNGHAALWDVITTHKTHNLDELWRDLWDPEMFWSSRSSIGEIFATHNVAAKLLSPLDTRIDPDTPHEFRVKANGGGDTYTNNKFTFIFMNQDHETVHMSDPVYSTSYTPDATAWEAIKNVLLAESEISWYVKGSNTAITRDKADGSAKAGDKVDLITGGIWSGETYLEPSLPTLWPDAGPAITGFVGENIELDASGSSGGVDLYEWQLEHSTTSTFQPDFASSSAVLYYKWDQPYSGLITLRVNRGGETAIDYVQVDISGNLPISGDIDGDGRRNNPDIDAIVNHITAGSTVTDCPQCDIDNDGEITVLDVEDLVLIVFDVDGNGELNKSDVDTLVNHITAGSTVTDCPQCDIDNDGEITVLDVEDFVLTVFDVDGSGELNKSDVYALVNHITADTTVSDCPQCDIDNDGEITVLDARQLMLMLPENNK